MKKLYLLLACAISFGTQAANLKLYMGDKEITPGSTVYFADYQAEEYEPGVWDIMMNPHLSVESDFFTNTVTVTATCTSGHVIQMCAGGLCNKGETVVKKDLTLQTGQKLALDFEYMNQEYEGAAVPDVTTVISAVDGNGTPVEFTIVMGPSATSLDKVIAAGYVRSTAAGIEYSIDGTQQIALYSITGNRVLSATISGKGVLPTAGIAKGVYVYTLGGTPGKIYVK